MLWALHQVGSAFFLYWDVVWYDVLVHFVGGFSLALLFVWIWYGSDMLGRRAMPARISAVLAAIAFVLLASAAWEIFEYTFDIANPVGENYSVDTFNDFVAATLGALCSGILGTLRWFHE